MKKVKEYILNLNYTQISLIIAYVINMIVPHDLLNMTSGSSNFWTGLILIVLFLLFKEKKRKLAWKRPIKMIKNILRAIFPVFILILFLLLILYINGLVKE